LAVGIVAIWGLRYLSNLFRKPDLPKEESRTNGFAPAGNLAVAGQAVPVIYGKRKTTPARVQEFIETIGDDQYYYGLYLVSSDEINAMSDIKLNDQPIANFVSASYETRMGTAGQSKIPWFADTRVTVAHGIVMNNDGDVSTFTMPGTSKTAFIVRLSFPSGLATVDANNNLKSNYVQVNIEYRVAGSGSGWTQLPNMPTQIREAKRNPFTREFRVDNLAANKYEIKVGREATGDRTAQSVFNMTYDTVDEIAYGNTSFPNFAMLGIKVKATDQISGTGPRVTLVVEGRKVRTRSGGVWTAPVFTRNPAWHIADMMTNMRYGGGAYISDAKLDIPALEAAASYYDELRDNLQSGTEERFVHDAVFDTQLDFYDAVDLVTQNCRSTIIETNDKYRLHVDRPRTLSQAFSNANIRRKTFRKGTVTLQGEFTQIEVSYIDEANDYTRDLVRFPTTNPQVLKRKQIALEHTTRRSQALYEAKHMMNSISALSEWCSFDTFLEGLTAEVGDVVEVSHDVPQWGYPGRIMASAFVSGTTYDLTVSRDDLPAPTDHRMLVRHETDLIEYGTVVSKTGDVVRVSGLSRLPKARDSTFHYGAANATGKLFQIQQGSWTPEFFRSLFLVDYDATVYDAPGLVYPARSPSDLPIMTAPPPSVTNLTLITQLIRNNQGMDTYRLQIHYNNPTAIAGKGVFRSAQIWLSNDGGLHYDIIDTVVNPPGYTHPLPQQTSPLYFVKVVAVSTTGVAEPWATAPTASIALTGDTTPPAIPTWIGSGATQGPEVSVQLRWNPVADGDFNQYRLYRNTVNDPNTATEVTRLQATDFIDSGVTEGAQFWWWLKSEDHAKNLSAFSAAATFTPAPINIDIARGFTDHFDFAQAVGDDLNPADWIVRKFGTAKECDRIVTGEMEMSVGTGGVGSFLIQSKKLLSPIIPAEFSKLRYEWKGRVMTVSPWADFLFRMGMGAIDARMVIDATTYEIVISKSYLVGKGTNANTIKFRTGSPVTGTETDNIAVDPSVSHIYVVEVDVGSPSPTAARLIVDGTVRATHTTNLPTELMSFAYVIGNQPPAFSLAAASRIDYVVYYGVSV
jgi:hypothetical protein